MGELDQVSGMFFLAPVFCFVEPFFAVGETALAASLAAVKRTLVGGSGYRHETDVVLGHDRVA